MAADARPSTDIAAAVQFARLKADQLRIDTDNIFLVGQSRGSLAVLTGMMNNQKTNPLKPADELYLGESSKPRAVFGVQASATYLHDQIKTTFLKRRASTTSPQPIAENGGIQGITQLQYPVSCNPTGVFDYFCQYDRGEQTINNPTGQPMSALDEMDPADPPVWLRYDRKPATSNGTTTGALTKLGLYMYEAGADQTKTNNDKPQNCYAADETCLDVHHPNFGVKLTQQYKSLPAPAGSTLYVFGQYAATSTREQRDSAGLAFYDNYWCFFLGYEKVDGTQVQIMTQAGNDLRKAAIDYFNDKRKPGVPALTYETCILKETDQWQQSFPH